MGYTSFITFNFNVIFALSLFIYFNCIWILGDVPYIFIILFGFGNGLGNTFQKYFNDDKSNTMFIFPGVTDKPFKGYESGRKIEFDNSDLNDIQEQFDYY